MRTSYAQGHPARETRDGYEVIRKAGRYMVFPRASPERGRRPVRPPGRPGRDLERHAVLLAAVGHRAPVVFLHHVHAEMWKMVLPPKLARLGDTMERRDRSAAVPAQPDHHPVAELEAGDARARLPRRPRRGHTAGRRPPLLPGRRAVADAARGRRRPARAGEAVRPADPGGGRGPRVGAGSTLVLVGTGPDRNALARAGALARRRSRTSPSLGGVSDSELIDLYRRAWAVCSTSVREGWGMTLTEAAACGTPAVATRIPGHVDAIDDGVSGLLADDEAGIVAHLVSDRQRPGAAGPAPDGRSRPRGAVQLGHDRDPHPADPGRGSQAPSGALASSRRFEGVDPAPSAPPAGSGADVPARRGDLHPAAAHQARQGQRRHQVLPLSRPRPDARPGSVDVGPEHRDGHGHPPEHRLPVADGAVLLAGAVLGVPDWVAQRLWLGSILFLAGVGVRYLLYTLGSARDRTSPRRPSSTR